MSSKRGKSESDQDQSKGESKKHERPTFAEYKTVTRLGLIAIIISIMALVVALFAPGPFAPRSIMAQRSVGGPVTIGTTCTHYPGAEVSISVPGAGTVVVSATVGVGINHVTGTSDEARIFLAISSSECMLNNYTAFVSIPFSLPTDPYHFVTVPLLRPFSVSGSSTMTFYVNGIMALGADAGDRFDSASLVAIYYPR